MPISGPFLSIAAMLIGVMSYAQSSVGALGKASDAAQHVFDGRTQVPTDTIWDLAAVEVQPRYPGGDTAMYSYLARTIIYPEEEADKMIAGKVYVEFVVRKDGHVDQVKVRRSATPAMDAEAVRAIQAMPIWEPGRLQDKPVGTRYVIPINFVTN